jgi:signal transduction histidine kinase
MNPQSLTGSSTIDAIPPRSLLNSLTRLYGLVVVLDSDGRIKWLHNRITSLPEIDDHLVGSDARRSFAEFMEPGLEFAIRSQLRKDGAVTDLSIRLPERFEAPASILLSVLPLETHDDEASLYVAVAREGSGGPAEPAASTDALERKNAELEHCVHSLAHDLRSPLVALLGFSRLLRQDYGPALDDTGRHFIDRIEQAGETMEHLIHDLLEFSRIGQGGERRAMNDPRGVLMQIAAESKPRLDSGGFHLVIPEHPPAVFCDRTRLYQVFSNLIGNALDHMGPCDDRSITIDVWDDDEGHQIAVSDHGRGIAAADHERIFEVFQSLGPATDGRRGSGLGLAIVKKIVETHGGRIWVESERGDGATFRMTYPRR